MPAAHAETRQIEIAPLGERLSALRLCEATAVTAVRRSLEQHGQLSAVTLFAADDRLEIIGGFKRVRAARSLNWPTLSARIDDVGSIDAKLRLRELHDRRGASTSPRPAPPTAPPRSDGPPATVRWPRLPTAAVDQYPAAPPAIGVAAPGVVDLRSRRDWIRRKPPPKRLPWSELLRRVFREDLLVCPRCTGRMTVLATITDPAVVDVILTHLDLPTEPPPVAPARAPPQVPFWPGGCDPPPDLDAYEPA